MPSINSKWSHRLIVLLALTLGGGCSIKRLAVNQVGNALAGGGATFSSDDDPELVKAAVPFSLKLMESLLAESPNHRGLLLASCKGFTMYSFAFVKEDADELEATDLTASKQLQLRARRLYLRARGYGLRGFEVSHRGYEQALRKTPKQTVAKATKADVPLLYWTAAAWGAAISLSKNDPDLIGDQPIVEALIDRALELDESYEHGAIHGFLITYEMARRGISQDEAVKRARKHFERALELSEGKLASPMVALAEQVSIQTQNKKEFRELLNRALAINIDAVPAWRLENLVMQRRARWLLSRSDELFVE